MAKPRPVTLGTVVRGVLGLAAVIGLLDVQGRAWRLVMGPERWGRYIAGVGEGWWGMIVGGAVASIGLAFGAALLVVAVTFLGFGVEDLEDTGGTDGE